MEWLTLPIKYCDVPLTGQLAITVWDIGGPQKPIPFGGTTIPLFDPDWYVYVPEMLGVGA